MIQTFTKVSGLYAGLGFVVVMKNLKLSLYAKVLSPIVIDKDEPDLTTYYNNMGSREGSNS